MAQTYTINGVDYTFPDVDDSDWGQNVTDWAGAVSSFLLQKSGGAFTLTAEVDFGANYGLLAKDLSSKTADPASAGFLQLAKTDVIAWRNDGTDGDINLAKKAGTDDLLQFNSIDLVNLSTAQTLTTKTLTSPVINTGISGSAIDDNASLGSSATKVPTQNAVKSYVDAQLGASDLEFEGNTGGGQSVDLSGQTFSLLGGTGLTSAGTAQTITFNVDAAQPGITSVGTLSALTVTGTTTSGAFSGPLTGNVTGNLTGDVAGDLTGSVLTAAQTNITSLGTLSALTVTGTTTSGAFSGPLTGNVTGNASTATALQTARTIGGTSFDGTGNIAVALASAATILETARTISMTGDVTWSSGSFDGSGNVTAAATLAANQASVTTAANLTTVGALAAGSIASGFGAIDNGTDGIKSNVITATTNIELDHQGSDPAAPAGGDDVILYAKTKKVYTRDGAGTVTELGAGGGAGDADTIQLKTAEASEGTGSAPWYTGNDLVPGGGGSIGGTWELSTSNPLINTNDATKVFHYSNATSNRKGDYFEIELDVPNYAKGHNLVVQLFYRTVGAEDTDFLFFARDRTADYSTEANGVQSATNNVVVDSSTGFAVGDRICFEDSSNARHFRYVTAVPDSTHVTFSGAAAAFADNAAIVTKFFTDELDYITAENNTTNYEGKIRKWAFQINDTTTKIRVGFLYDNSATSTNELFFDQILLSSNQFLQAQTSLPTENYFVSGGQVQANGVSGNTTQGFYIGSTETPDVNTINKFGTVVNDNEIGFKFTANQDVIVNANICTARAGNASWTNIVAGPDSALTNADSGGSAFDPYRKGASYVPSNEPQSTSAEFRLAKGEVFRFMTTAAAGRYTSNSIPTIGFSVRAEVSSSILLNSQDEIFTDWQIYTPSFTNMGTPSSIEFFWRRVGDQMEVRGRFVEGTGTAAIAYLHIPSGYSIDAGKLPASSATNAACAVGSWGRDTASVGGTNGFILYDGSTSSATGVSFSFNNNTGGFALDSQYGSWIWGGAGIVCTFNFKVPIAGWTSTFNPVLSMPLVDLGQPVETWHSLFNDNFWDGTGSQFTWDISLLERYPDLGGAISDSNLITVSDITSGSNTVTAITAKQDIILTAQIVGEVTNTAAVYWFDSKDNVVLRDQVQGANGPLTFPITVNLKAGDYVYCQHEVAYTRKGNIIINAQRVQSGNMAHIIKPAVAILKDVKAYNSHGGGSSAGWNTRTLNTLEGESWFVTKTSDTQFKINGGMYKLSARCPSYKGSHHFVALYNTTTSSYVQHGSATYAGSTLDVTNYSELEIASFSHTSADDVFELRHYITNAQGTNGLGSFTNVSGFDSIYAVLKIEKLK